MMIAYIQIEKYYEKVSEKMDTKLTSQQQQRAYLD